MRQDERAPFDRALHRARVSAYAPGAFVGQESFMTAGEIRALAVQAGVGPGVAVLDLCCGIAGPGRFVTRELGCDYLGVDASPSAVAIAREQAGGLPCRFEVAAVPPVPAGSFDVVLLLETLLAFEHKEALERFKTGQFSFAAGSSAVVLKSGAAANANFVDGVAVVVQPIGGVSPAALGQGTEPQAPTMTRRLFPLIAMGDGTLRPACSWHS